MLILINQCSIFLECFLWHRKRAGWSKAFPMKVPPRGKNIALPQQNFQSLPLGKGGGRGGGGGGFPYLLMLFGKPCFIPVKTKKIRVFRARFYSKLAKRKVKVAIIKVKLLI